MTTPNMFSLHGKVALVTVLRTDRYGNGNGWARRALARYNGHSSQDKIDKAVAAYQAAGFEVSRISF